MEAMGGRSHLWLCTWGARPQHPQIRVTTPRDPAPTQQGRTQGSGPSSNTLCATNEPRGAALSPPAPNPFLPPTQPESVRGRGWGTQSQHRTSSNCRGDCTAPLCPPCRNTLQLPFPGITHRILPKSLRTATEQGMELGPRLLGSLQANEREHICWLLTVGLFGNVLIKHFSQKIPTRRE